MPTAREALLRSALAALADLPWSAIRMVDVASGAGVSRQTLYNEFGSKDGLARALMRREADRYLHGVERLLGERADAADRLVAVAEWTVGEARARPLLRALLTGCWGSGSRRRRPRGRPPPRPPSRRSAARTPGPRGPRIWWHWYGTDRRRRCARTHAIPAHAVPVHAIPVHAAITAKAITVRVIPAGAITANATTTATSCSTAVSWPSGSRSPISSRPAPSP